MSTQFLKQLASVFVVLLVLWVIYLYRQVPHQRVPFAKAVDATEKIVLKQDAHTVQLVKEGKIWKVLLGGNDKVLADSDHIKGLMINLKDLQLEDEISNNPERAAEFEVDAASGTRISLQDAKGVSLAEGIFGKQAPDLSHIYFRSPEEPTVYLARGLIRGEIGKPDPSAWRSRQLFDIPETKIQRIVMEGKDFRTDLMQVSTDTWTLNGKPADSGFVNALIGTYAHAHADDFVDTSANPNLTFEGLTYARIHVQGPDAAVDFRIGVQDPRSKRYPASAGKENGLVWLTQAILDSILKKPAVFEVKR